MTVNLVHLLIGLAVCVGLAWLVNYLADQMPWAAPFRVVGLVIVTVLAVVILLSAFDGLGDLGSFRIGDGD